MSALPLYLAVALLAEPAPVEPEPIPAPQVAPAPVELPPPAAPSPAPAPPPRERIVGFAGGVALGHYDDIPVTLCLLRGSLVALAAPEAGRLARPGFGLSAELFGGRTQRGLGTGGFSIGPGAWLSLGPLRVSATAEVGYYGVETATTRIVELMLVGLLRAGAELDVWPGKESTLVLGASGWIGNANGIPVRAASAFLGVRL